MANVLNTFYLSKTGYITNINPLPKIIKQKMGITIIFVTFLLCFCLFTSNAQGFEDVYAIINGTVNTGTGETINKGTIIIRNGLIENVGKNIPLPPDAIIIDSKSLQIYPGIINTFSTLGIPKTSDKQKSAQNKGQDNNKLVNSDVSSFDYINMKAAEIKAARESGITTALVAQPEGIFQGTSVLLNLLDEAPEKAVVKTNIAQHLSFSKNPKGYPGSSMGIIAFIRQTFYDVDHYRETMEIYNDQQQGFKRPEYNKSLESLFPVINEKLPIIIDAHKEMEIRCAIKIANEFNLNYILCGVTEGFLTGELLKRENKPVIVSLKFPEPKTVTGYDFALRVKGPVKTDKEKEKKKEDEEVTEMLYKNASVLAANNIPFAFTMGAKGKPQDLLKNVRTAVEHGLSETDALKALTINAARILSADRQIGSIEKGKIANLVITEGNIFDKKSKLKNVFIDGKKFDIKEPKKKENKNKKSD